MENKGDMMKRIGNETEAFRNNDTLDNDINLLLDRIKDMADDDWQWEIERFRDRLENMGKELIFKFYYRIEKKLDEFDENTDKASKYYIQVKELFYSIYSLNSRYV